MASHNDFKFLREKARKYSDYLNLKKNLKDTMKERLGFYLLIVESITGIKEIDAVIDCITDTEFMRLCFDEENNDMGVDAIAIDEDEKIIRLFNFKYRESFDPKKGQKVNVAHDSIKLIPAIYGKNTSGLDAKTKEAVEKIIEANDSREIWETELYIVSNENNKLPPDDPYIKSLVDHYGIVINSIDLNDIASFISDRPKQIDASVILDTSSIMTYEENRLSSRKSYLVSMSLSDLIRITCTDPIIRKSYNIEDYSLIREAKLDFGVLFDNVRGYLGKTKYNDNILTTLNREPSKFFLYNNGVTITAKNIRVSFKNGNSKMLTEIEGLQVVNGGQTIRTVYNFKEIDFNEEKLATARVLVRMFQTDNDDALTNSIAEFTNSQNAISVSDLKSVSNLQIKIESFLRDHDIHYKRKVGDTGGTRTYKFTVSMDRMAQLIFSKKGFPEKTTRNKKGLFEKYYDQIFYDEMDFIKYVEYANEYEKIVAAYSSMKTKGFEQKYLYCMYLNTFKPDIHDNIQTLEKCLKEYKKDEIGLSDSKKLIQSGFKDFLDIYILKDAKLRV